MKLYYIKEKSFRIFFIEFLFYIVLTKKCNKMLK